MWNTSQTPPDVGTEVIVYVAGRGLMAIASLERDGDELYWETDCDELAASPVAAVTHWMPLPPSPSLD